MTDDLASWLLSEICSPYAQNRACGKIITVAAVAAGISMPLVQFLLQGIGTHRESSSIQVKSEIWCGYPLAAFRSSSIASLICEEIYFPLVKPLLSARSYLLPLCSSFIAQTARFICSWHKQEPGSLHATRSWERLSVSATFSFSSPMICRRSRPGVHGGMQARGKLG